jgi:hypothetical protein
MNYTSFTLGDKKLGLKFGMASFRYLQNKFTKGVVFADNDLNEIGISHIIYSGYYNNCLVKDVEPEVSFEELVEYVELNLLNDEFVNKVKEIVDIWSNSDFIKQSTPQEETKKKMTRGKK